MSMKFEYIDINTEIQYTNNMFDTLLHDILSYDFEMITKGRCGCVIVSDNVTIPIVRTTTKYNKPMQKFNPTIIRLIDIIKDTIDKKHNIKIDINNILAEIYDNNYKTMGFHSDQALDLSDESYIIVYSCYDNPNIHQDDMRKLIIKGKNDNYEKEIYLTHNSFVIFDTKTNKEHLHKIVLNEKSKKHNMWHGLTMRLSKTCVKHIDNNIIFCDSNKIMHYATNEELKEFYKLRSGENKVTEYTYPEILYTISPGDLLPIQT